MCVCVDQVDELYEAFCIQSRLREGAIRMKQAFSSSPSTKGTKESIAEVNRRYKEYTEVRGLGGGGAHGSIRAVHGSIRAVHHLWTAFL